MAQPPHADPEWIAMRAQHQQECAAFARQTEADRQALHRRHEAEKEELVRRVDAVKAELLGRHSQQEGAYWTGHYQKQSKTSSLAPTLSLPQVPTPSTQKTPSRPSAAPASAPRQKPLPTPDAANNPLSLKALDEHKKNGQKATAATATQQHAKQQLKQSPVSRQTQQQNKKAVSTGPRGALQPSKPGQRKQGKTTPQSKASSKKDIEPIDLCFSDDDMLVEVTKATYQEKTTPIVAPAPSLPSTLTATPQLFGEASQKQALNPASTYIKQEKPEVAQPTQGHPQPHVPELFQNSISKSSTSLQSAHPRNIFQKHDTAASSRLSSIVSERAATNAQPYRPAQSLPSAAHKKDAVSFGRNTVTSGHVQGQQVQDICKLTVSHATVPTFKDLSTLQYPYQNGGFAKLIPENEEAKSPVPGSSDVFGMRKSNVDVDMEDVPLALLNVKAMLKRLGATTSREDSTNVDLPTPEATECSASKKDTQKTHLPSPSPSLASAPSTPTIDETTALLNRFKKPTVPPSARETPGIKARTVDSRASSCTFATASDPATPSQRQASIVSQTSNVSSVGRKRKQIDLSDDEQSDCSPSEPSSNIRRKKSTIVLGSLLRNPPKPKDPPPPSTSPLSPAGKKTNGLGFRTNARPASPNKTSTPTQSALDASAKALSNLPSKRKAAVRAQSEVQRIIEADEQFYIEDTIHRASAAREPRRGGTCTTELGTRLRSMSITPVPMGTRSGSPKTSTAREEPIQTSHKTGAVGEDDVCGRTPFSKDRATRGDRLANRNRNINKFIGEDSDDEFMEDLDTC